MRKDTDRIAPAVSRGACPGVDAPLPHRLTEARAEEVSKDDLGLEAASFRDALHGPVGGGKETLRFL